MALDGKPYDSRKLNFFTFFFFNYSSYFILVVSYIDLVANSTL